MALIICEECGKEVSDKAKTCPNCGCPINKEEHSGVSQELIQEEPKKKEKPKKKKDSKLSNFAAILSLCKYTAFIGFLLASVDIGKKDTTQKHGCSYFAIVVCALWLLSSIFGGSSKSDSKSVGSSEKQIDVLLCEDENVRIYIDHIKNGQIFLRLCNDSDNNLNMQYGDLTINGDRYYKGFFVEEVYSHDEDVVKLTLYDKDGNPKNYDYDSGTISGKFDYMGTGVSFVTELDINETQF